MGNNHDSTTRTKLADAINSVVAMSDAETEEMIDAVLDMQPERLELNQIQDRLDDRLRWVYGILDMMQSEPDSAVAEPIVDAASGAAHYVREAQEFLRSLDLWRHEHQPTKARDLTNANQREDEKRDIVRRLLQLKHQDTSDVTMCHIMIDQMEDQSEGLRLLDKYPLTYVYKFLSVQKDEAERENAATAAE